jgi:hypothetical protein
MKNKTNIKSPSGVEYIYFSNHPSGRIYYGLATIILNEPNFSTKLSEIYIYILKNYYEKS